MTNKSGAKDVIYIDVDDEITAVIDRVRTSGSRIIALVLPKRATAFQSIVNMKLLKRSAEHEKKNIVLITSEPSMVSLAGGVGLHVAKSLSSKPEVPEVPGAPRAKGDEEELVDSDDEPSIDKSKSLAELNGDEEETIELDNSDIKEPQEEKSKKHKIGGGGKKFKIPNFSRFRLLLLAGGGGVIALIIVIVLAVVVLPKAQVTVSTDSSAINVSQDLQLKIDEGVTLDVTQSIVPATKKEVKKTISAEVPTTGQRNDGEKATGEVTLSLKDCTKAKVTVPAGVGLNAGGKTFITQSSATLKSVEIGGDCMNSSYPSQSTKVVGVIAQTGGAANNIAPSSFTVAGYSNVAGASSAAMTGGTDVIVKIVAQDDIESAKKKIEAEDRDAIKTDLIQALQDEGLYPVEASFNTTAPDTKQNVEVGAEAESVIVTQEVAYSMLGVNSGDLERIVAEQVNTKIDKDKQNILDYGIGEATFTSLTSRDNVVTVGFQATAITGSDLSVNEIKKQVAGKKASEAKEIIEKNPGVTDVKVKYSPFWVSSIPKSTSKITVIIERPEVVK